MRISRGGLSLRAGYGPGRQHHGNQPNTADSEPSLWRILYIEDIKIEKNELTDSGLHTAPGGRRWLGPSRDLDPALHFSILLVSAQRNQHWD